jgi:hypothetical protein
MEAVWATTACRRRETTGVGLEPMQESAGMACETLGGDGRRAKRANGFRAVHDNWKGTCPWRTRGWDSREEEV